MLARPLPPASLPLALQSVGAVDQDGNLRAQRRQVVVNPLHGAFAADVLALEDDHPLPGAGVGDHGRKGEKGFRRTARKKGARGEGPAPPARTSEGGLGASSGSQAVAAPKPVPADEVILQPSLRKIWHRAKS